jgi:hypothetical protein
MFVCYLLLQAADSNPPLLGDFTSAGVLGVFISKYVIIYNDFSPERKESCIDCNVPMKYVGIKPDDGAKTTGARNTLCTYSLCYT